eukprot:2750774-Amphidinium_carterae.2
MGTFVPSLAALAIPSTSITASEPLRAVEISSSTFHGNALDNRWSDMFSDAREFKWWQRWYAIRRHLLSYDLLLVVDPDTAVMALLSDDSII